MGTALPDQVVINELSSRCQVFRTDTNDAACKTNPAKIGPDVDGRAGVRQHPRRDRAQQLAGVNVARRRLTAGDLRIIEAVLAGSPEPRHAVLQSVR